MARAIPDRPVLLKWSREDEHAWEPYGPAMRMELAAHLDDAGDVRFWSHETLSDTHVVRARPGAAGPQAGRFLAPRYVADRVREPARAPNLTLNGGIHRNATPPYAFPETRIVKHLVHDLPLRVSALRTLGAYANVFAAESFLDELAHAAGADPLDYRRRHLKDARTRAVLDAAAERFGWAARAAAGRSVGAGAGAGGDAGAGRGIAVARYKNAKSYCAVAVEARVGDDAAIHPPPGGDRGGRRGDRRSRRARRPARGRLRAGRELDPTRSGRLGPGRHRQPGLESYPILRFSAVPEIETVLVDRPGEPFLGAGEASCGPAGAAIANAVFDATGVRARRLPLTPESLREAAAES